MSQCIHKLPVQHKLGKLLRAVDWPRLFCQACLYWSGSSNLITALK